MGLGDPGWFPHNRIWGEITEWAGVIWCRSDRSEREEGGEGEFSHFDSLAAPRPVMPVGYLTGAR